MGLYILKLKNKTETNQYNYKVKGLNGGGQAENKVFKVS